MKIAEIYRSKKTGTFPQDFCKEFILRYYENIRNFSLKRASATSEIYFIPNVISNALDGSDKQFET